MSSPSSRSPAPGRPPVETEPASAPLVDRLAEELIRRWAQGETPQVEELFARHPELLEEPTAALELMYEEVCLREEAGQPDAWKEMSRRFPRWHTHLYALQECHHLLQPGEAAPRLPGVGEMLGEFRLLVELGRGARGWVYLAAQTALGNRPVVLKLTPRSGREHVSLARLQHTNIVPLYTARDDRIHQVRMLCMPYLGNATLAQLLAALAPLPHARRRGQDLVDALEQIEARRPPVPLAPVAAAKQFLARASYGQTICWIGACCADALHYAHERGLVHLDLKPSNVLIAADGQPMLLDFHLAHEPLQPDKPAPEELGGTPAYMAPEQRAAVEAVGLGQAVPMVVDGRADLYSLGAVLYEALGGSVPYEPHRSPPLSRLNPQVSVGLSDIVARCVQPDASQRYADAATLAADLRRHLAHQPLVGVANRSPRERWQKWRRRHPTAFRRVLFGVSLAAIALTFAAGTWFYFAERRGEAEHALHEGQHLWQQRQAYAEAVATLEHGLARIEPFPFWRELAQQLRDQVAQARQAHTVARRAQLVRDLHGHVERLRLLLCLEEIPAASLRGLEPLTRALWEGRALLGSDVSGELNDDLLDLAVSWADLLVRLAPAADGPAARRQALHVLAEAETLFGPRAILAHERQAHQRALGLEPAAPARSLVAQTVWERNALGRALLRAGEVERAGQELRQACNLEPHNPWSNYYYGLCAYRLGRYQDAALAFSVCVGAAPHLAGCYYSRALALTALGRAEQALHDYDRALQLDPTLGAAALNRGMLHYQAKRYDQALADLRQAQCQGMDPAMVCYDLALVHLARGDLEAARTCVQQALHHAPEHAESLRLRQTLEARPMR